MADKQLEALLKSQHPIYTAWVEEWKQNERRMKGGQEVVNADLVPFEWEEADGDYFTRRKQQAVYVNFPARVALTMMGSLERKAPKPGKGLDFGSMGNPDQASSIAYHIWNNADGAGMDGSAWDPWWNTSHQMAMATGHRWILVESPRDKAPGANVTTVSEAIKGRPYLVEYSPVSVPMWHFDGQGLAWVVIKLKRYQVDKANQGFKVVVKDWYYLHVRGGYTDLDGIAGLTFSTGGWWLFNPDFKLDSTGNYDRTGGEIPMVVLYYERAKSTEDRARMSRPGLGEIANLAVSYMNLSSAGDFDAISSGGRTVWISGVDSGQHQATVQQVSMGGRVIGIPKMSPEHPNPQLYDLASASANEAINSRLEARKAEVALIAADETAMAPGASGVSKDAGYKDRKSPRLANLAKERQSAQQATIRFLELRAAQGTPSGKVIWPTEYDLMTLASGVMEVAQVASITGAQSPTLSASLVNLAMRESGVYDALDAETVGTINDEILEAGQEAQRAGSLLRAALEAPGTGDDPEDPDGA